MSRLDRRGWVEYYRARDAYAVTFAFNRKSIPKFVAVNALREFDRQVNRSNLGPRFYKKNKQKSRLDFLVVPELALTNTHFHGFMIIPRSEFDLRSEPDVFDKYQSIWEGLYPSGSLDIMPVYDASGWADYCSEESCLAGHQNVWSLDFSPT